MPSRGLRSSSFLFSFFFFALIFIDGLSGRAVGQATEKKTYSSPESHVGNRPYLRDQLDRNWNLRGRGVPPGESAGVPGLRSYRQKMTQEAPRAATPPPSSPVL